MQNRIPEHPEFETTIRNSPIELLNKIKVVLMHNPIRAKYVDSPPVPKVTRKRIVRPTVLPHHPRHRDIQPLMRRQ
jgi:hypothetical protein